VKSLTMRTPSDLRQVLVDLYRDFNARRIDAVLAMLDADVHWPNGWEGGYVNGRDEVRDYWTRQWAAIDPSVEPIGFEFDDGRVIVSVHQVVRDKSGNVLGDEIVRHAYVFRGGLIASMEISK
jgi:hypothetical protein